MRYYALRRILQMLPTAAAILSLSFVLIHAAPGDPVLALAGEHGDAEYYAFMRERFGLDESLPKQFATYAARLLQGNFGVSYVQGRNALELVIERAPATLLLTGASLLLALLVGVPLGAWAARRRGKPGDSLVVTATLSFYSAPAFWIGQLAILVFAVRLGWLPVEGIATAGSKAGGFARAVDVIKHLALPVLVLASHEIAVLTRLTRAGLIHELERDHVRTARAKGLPESAVLITHAMSRIWFSLVTVLGARLGQLLAGALVIEIVFGWPGLGRLLLTSLQARDTPVILALFFVTAFSVMVANLLTDLVYAAIDPRVRYS